MSKTRIAGQLERLIQGLREKESAKKAELLLLPVSAGSTPSTGTMFSLQ